MDSLLPRYDSNANCSVVVEVLFITNSLLNTQNIVCSSLESRNRLKAL